MRERAACGVCSGTAAEIVFRGADVREGKREEFPVGRCVACGHYFVVERPPASEIGRYYPADYGAHRRVDDGASRDSKRARKIRRRAPFRILDVGCGSGYDLLPFRDRGCAVFGLEMDPEAAEEARRHGIEVQSCSVERATFPDGQFDVITMNHVVEHLHDPAAGLRNVRRMLHADGEVHLLFPTAEGLFFRVFGPHWYHLDVPRHLQFFTHAAFARLARAAGLRVVDRRCRSGSRSLRRSLGAADSLWTRAAGLALRLGPVKLYSRAALKLLDALRQGDVAEYVLRKAVSDPRPATGG